MNVKGTLRSIRAALPLLRRGGGRVVCIGSVGGVLAGPHYVASKGAVHALVKWLARTEAANGILARSEEIARVAAFLASPAASYQSDQKAGGHGPQPTRL